MSKRNADGLDIPAFLLVKNRGKVKPKMPKGVAKRVAPVDPYPAIFEAMEPELRSHVEKELKAGRLQRFWLLDPSTVDLLRSEISARAERHAAAMERLAALKEERRKERADLPPRPAFGSGMSVRVTVKENPRKPGTQVFDRFARMVAFVRANPRASAAEMMAATGYRKDDLAWDESQGWIKTDIIKKEK